MYIFKSYFHRKNSGIKIKETREIDKDNFTNAIYKFTSPRTDYHNLMYKPQIGTVALINIKKPIFNVIYSKRLLGADKISLGFLRNKKGEM